MIEPTAKRSLFARRSAKPAAPVAPRPMVAQPPAAVQGALAPSQRRTPRKARLRLTRIDPWSVMKVAFLLSIALAIVTVIAVMTVWAVLGAAGVWSSINSAVASVVGGESSSFNINDYVGLPRVLGLTVLIAAADVVLLTVASTLLAFLYNMAASLLGGIELTLAEEES